MIKKRKVNGIWEFLSNEKNSIKETEVIIQVQERNDDIIIYSVMDCVASGNINICRK